MRSFTLPSGLKNSHFIAMVVLGSIPSLAGMRFSLTSGVRPIVSTMSLYMRPMAAPLSYGLALTQAPYCFRIIAQRSEHFVGVLAEPRGGPGVRLGHAFQPDRAIDRP